MNPELARSGHLRTLQAEIRSTIRGCARMAPVDLANHPGLLEQLADLAEGIDAECIELEERQSRAA